MSSEIIAMHEAKSTLSQLVQRAVAGETVLIGPHGKAVVKLTALGSPTVPGRKLGLLKGKLKVPADFDQPLPADVLEDFEGKAT